MRSRCARRGAARGLSQPAGWEGGYRYSGAGCGVRKTKPGEGGAVFEQA